MAENFKKRFGIIASVLFHLLLLLFSIRMFDRDRFDHNEYQKTQTRGYTVQLVQQPDQVPPPTAPKMVENTAAAGGSPDQILNTKEQINFKDNSEELAKQAAAKKAKDDAAKAKRDADQKAREAARQAREKARQEAEQERLAKGEQPPKPKSEANPGIKIHQAPPQKQLITTASAPIVDYTKQGSGDAIDASTNGHGTQAGQFDLRRIQYGRAAAYAIRQNIVTPPGFEGNEVPYEAYVTLDHNMQFSKMEVVKSTGDPAFDANIAKALQQTIYPPLPPGADWNIYHNIDFTIHN